MLQRVEQNADLLKRAGSELDKLDARTDQRRHFGCVSFEKRHFGSRRIIFVKRTNFVEQP